MVTELTCFQFLLFEQYFEFLQQMLVTSSFTVLVAEIQHKLEHLCLFKITFSFVFCDHLGVIYT